MTIAIIAAMSEEIQHLVNTLEDCHSQSLLNETIWQGSYAGQSIVLALSGIGKVNAAKITALLIQQFAPDYVINTGSAGGIGQAVSIGDVVIATTLAHHDVDVCAFGYTIGQVPKMPERFVANAHLNTLLTRAASAFSQANVHQGLIVSGDQFISSQSQIQHIRNHFPDVLACEMEAAAVAQVCHSCHTPFAVVRAISDHADESADQSFEEFLHTASVHSAQMVLNLIELLKD